MAITKIYVQRFVVEGTMFFPLDMLRYDRCYPHDGASTSMIVDSQKPTDRQTKRVSLERYVFGEVYMPSFERWSSFAWRVDEKSIETKRI